MEPEERRVPLVLSPGAVPTAPYVSRPPSPPYILIPSVTGGSAMSIVPSYENSDPVGLTEEELLIITQNNKPQEALDQSIVWNYDMRRRAQQILDFLYLGPWTAAKDVEFLRREGITMLLGCRDGRQASVRLMNVDKAAAQLGIVADHVDVADHQQLSSVFTEVVAKINNHLLEVYRSQEAQAQAQRRQHQAVAAIDPVRFRRGKVLVFCETGSERSAAVVAAYIMTIYGMDMVGAIQFVHLQRFCANFDEDTKMWLRAYQDIQEARRMVSRNNRLLNRVNGSSNGRSNNIIANNSSGSSSIHRGGVSRAAVKRSVDEMADSDDEDGATQQQQQQQQQQREQRPQQAPHCGGGENGLRPQKSPPLSHGGKTSLADDLERFQNRANFAPFVDSGKDTQMWGG